MRPATAAGLDMPNSFENSLAQLPEGQYAVAVSGGADSVALLRLMMQYRPDVGLHVVHLNHQTRAEESDGDADFVRDLAVKFRLPVTIARRVDIEPAMQNRPRNKSALFRAMRFTLFKKVAAENGLHGVLLAHHRDDQAETVLHRLLRGSGPAGLTGIARQSRHGILILYRPLLAHGHEELREYLKSIQQPWREDSSNISPTYLRNRLRPLLAFQPELSHSLVEMAKNIRHLREWIADAAPDLPEKFPATALADLSPILAAESARRWLINHGAPPSQLPSAVLDRFVSFATDAASGNFELFPGKIRVRRRRGWIEAG